MNNLFRSYFLLDYAAHLNNDKRLCQILGENGEVVLRRTGQPSERLSIRFDVIYRGSLAARGYCKKV